MPSPRRVQQILHSVPLYVDELAQIRRPRDLYFWAYHKFPYAFPLAKFPLKVGVELLNECNFACTHCFRHVMHRKAARMDLGLAKKIADEVGAQRCCDLKIGGLGEPALHPEFPELMAVFGQRSRPILYTNGTVLKLFPADVILGWNLNTLVVSVDGLDSDSYQRIRIGGTYDELKNLVATFRMARDTWSRRRNPTIEIRHVIMPSETNAGISEFRKVWQRLGDAVAFNYLITFDGNTPRRTARCRDIRREVCIRADGRMTLCGCQELHESPEWLGSVRDASIAELWRHPRLMQLRRCHEKRDFGQFADCQACPAM